MIRTILFILFAMVLSTSIWGQQPMEIIVQLQPRTPISALLNDLNTSRAHSLVTHTKVLSRRHNIHLLTDHSGAQNDTLLYRIKNQSLVLGAEINTPIAERTTPNDTFYGEQWSLEHLGLPSLWKLNTGGLTPNGDTIVVAILDSGFDISHPDLEGNIWFNRAEIPADGIDNDNNGYIDDLTGWNFREDAAMHEHRYHGQGVAGIIGAKGNNDEGITGINWNIKMMLFSCGDASQIIAAYDYIIEQRTLYNTTNGEEGAFVVVTNLSLGIPNKFCEEFPVWGGMYDQLGAVGILTSAAPPNQHTNIAINGDMPTTCTSPYIIPVMNTTAEDEKYSGSAYSSEYLDLGVPGHDSYTTNINDGYRSFGGNSAAAPHLAGTIALLYSMGCESIAQDAITHPSETALKFRDYILDGVEEVSALEQYTITGGRLSPWDSAQLLFADCEQTKGDLAIERIYPLPAQDMLTVELETPDFEIYQFALYNVLGQKVWERDFRPNFFGKKSQQINVGHLGRGAYWLTLSKGDTQVTEMIMLGF